MSSGKTATMKYFIRNLDQQYYVNNILIILICYKKKILSIITYIHVYKYDKMINLFPNINNLLYIIFF